MSTRTMFAVLATTLMAFACDNGGTTAGDCESCAETEACCGDSCVTLSSDAQNCGACGIRCSSGICSNGSCVELGDGGRIDAARMDTGPLRTCSPECASDQRCCGGRCVDESVPLNSDGREDPTFDNCNGCGLACDGVRASACSVPGGGGGGAPRCMCGDLNECEDEEMCVAREGGGFDCVTIGDDPMNCGGVGIRCADGELCIEGMCQCGSTGTRCGEGEGCCGGSCVDVSADAENCGACGNACGANAPTCDDGMCVCGSSGRACEAPMRGGIIGGGGSLGETCCDGECVDNGDTNCGGCGVMCDVDDDESCIFNPIPIPILGQEICCGRGFICLPDFFP